MDFTEERHHLRRSGTQIEIYKAIAETLRKQNDSKQRLEVLKEDIENEEQTLLTIAEHQDWLLQELERDASEAQQTDELDIELQVSPAKTICYKQEKEIGGGREKLDNAVVITPLDFLNQSNTTQESLEFGVRASQVQTQLSNPTMIPRVLFTKLPDLECETQETRNGTQKKQKKRKHFDQSTTSL